MKKYVHASHKVCEHFASHERVVTRQTASEKSKLRRSGREGRRCRVPWQNVPVIFILFFFFVPQKGQKGRLGMNIIIYLNETRELKVIYVFWRVHERRVLRPIGRGVSCSLVTRTNFAPHCAVRVRGGISFFSTPVFSVYFFPSVQTRKNIRSFVNKSNCLTTFFIGCFWILPVFFFAIL